MADANLLLYMNLTGEVFYIVGHRMKSQNVRDELQTRVYNDLAMAICHPSVVKDLMEGSLNVLRLQFAEVKVIMDRIVHSSIMTVNAFSMEKLFELTLIATKYQYSVCQNSKDILLIALNHLDTIRSTLTDVLAIQLSENMHGILTETYGGLASWIMQKYRYSVLNYLIDVRLKMTNLIKLGYQKPTGEFVKHFPDKELHPDNCRPGTIEIYDYEYTDDVEDIFEGQEKTTGEPYQYETLNIKLPIEEPPNLTETARHVIQFETDYLNTEYRDITQALELNAPRGIRLGLSIYDIPGNADDVEYDYSQDKSDQFVPISSQSYSTKFQKTQSVETVDSLVDTVDLKAIQGLDLCSVLLGCSLSESNNFSSKIKLPGMPREYETTEQSSENSRRESSGSINVVQIDARTNRSSNKSALAAIAKEFDIDPEENNQSQRDNDIILDE